jgi:hypothetical protein
MATVYKFHIIYYFDKLKTVMGHFSSSQTGERDFVKEVLESLRARQLKELVKLSVAQIYDQEGDYILPWIDGGPKGKFYFRVL